MSRYRARESAFLLLFEAGFHKDMPIDALVVQFYAREDAKELGDETQYFEDLVQRVTEAKDELDEKIKTFSIGWSVGRISRVARAILAIAIIEIDEYPDIPVSVSVNEAVNLAKAYDSQEAAAFINGILASYIRQTQGEQAIELELELTEDTGETPQVSEDDA